MHKPLLKQLLQFLQVNSQILYSKEKKMHRNSINHQHSQSAVLKVIIIFLPHTKGNQLMASSFFSLSNLDKLHLETANTWTNELMTLFLKTPKPTGPLNRSYAVQRFSVKPFLKPTPLLFPKVCSTTPVLKSKCSILNQV